MTKEDIIARINALLAKSKDKGATEEEALACANLASKLMLKHQIEEFQLGKEPDEVIVITHPSKITNRWRRFVAVAAATLYQCKILINRNPRTGRDEFLIIGRPENARVCESMITYFFEAVRRISRKSTAGKTNKEFLSFERGCGEGLAYRLSRLHEERMKSAAETTEIGMALVVVSGKEIDKFINSKLGGSVPFKSGKGSEKDGSFYNGFSKSKEIGIDEQIGDSKSKAKEIE